MNRPLYLLVLAATAAGLSGCGQGEARNAIGRVIAKVDGREISVRQARKAAPGHGDLPGAQSGAPAALERIIDQEVLAQKAQEAGLDRDLQVMHAIENAKRRVLARAYLDRAAGAMAADTPEEISRFYRDNPALFERRRLYRMTELHATMPPEKFAMLRNLTMNAKSMGEIADWLETEKLPFQAVASSKPAESIPLNVLPQVSEMKEGQIAAFATPSGATVVQLLKSTDAPLSESEAAPLIRQFLFNRKWLEFAQSEVRRLRDQARIQYVGNVESEHLAMSAPFAANRGEGAGNQGYLVEHGLAEFQ